jgi:hypothetical protein
MSSLKHAGQIGALEGEVARLKERVADLEEAVTGRPDLGIRIADLEALVKRLVDPPSEDEIAQPRRRGAA